MKNFVKVVALLLTLAVAGLGQSIYSTSTAFASCAAVTTTGACAYATLPLFGGSTLSSSFSWATIYTGSPSGTTVNLEGSFDGRTTMDVVATSGSTTITSATMRFTQADVGKSVYVSGAGSSGGVLVTTISSVSNSTTAVLSNAASSSIAAAPALVGSFYQLDQTVNTSGEMRSVVNKPVKFVRCNVTTLSGGTSPTATCSFVAKGQ